MNGKKPAKAVRASTTARAPLVSLATLAAVMATGAALADDGNLTQQVRIEQSKSQFQLQLEQIEARARQRAAAAAAGNPGARPARVDLGDSGDSLRLEPIDVGDPALPTQSLDSARELELKQAYDRDERWILDQRQRRDALRADSPVIRSNGIGAYARERQDRVRYQTENRQQAVQRKLRP